MRLLILPLLLLLASPCLASPKIVVSISPLHALVSALTKGVDTPQLLLPQSGSPHSGSLRPSQAKALAETDLLIWVGPELESFLTQPVARLVRPQAAMQLLELKGLKLLTQRHGGFWEEEQHAEETGELHSVNPHIWLSPENARRIVTAVGARLSSLDPPNREIYQANLAQLLLRIERLQRELSERLTPISHRPYLVFHDAYPYFEEAFSLNAIGSIRISADRAPGARRLQQIRSKISQSAAVCLFSEPQFSPTLAENLAEGNSLKLGVLDPLGNSSASGEDGWFRLMENLATSLIECLQPKPE